MSADDHSTIAGRELLGIIHELEAEEAVIRDHNKVKSDIIKEAGNKGYDKKTIRKVMAARRLDPLERGEQDNLFDMYMHAVETAEKEAAHARVENAGKFGAAKPVTDTQEQPGEPATQSEQPSAPTVANEYAGTSSDENPAPISPSVAPPADTVAEPQSPQTATVPIPNPQPTSSPAIADEAEAVTPPAASASHFDNPAANRQMAAPSLIAAIPVSTARWRGRLGRETNSADSGKTL